MDYDDLIKYLNQHSSPQERAAVEAWLKAAPENEAHFRKVKKLWKPTAAKTVAPDVDEAWNKLRGSITVDRKVKRLTPRVWQAAAAIAVLLIAFSIWYQLRPSPMMIVNHSNQLDALRVALPDGSIAWLNRNSTLHYPKEFKGKERRVRLAGEAFFEVQRNEAKPFRVETNETITEVLGTSFDLMAYPDSARQWIQVHSGKVSYASKEGEPQAIILQKEEGAVFDLNSQSVVAKPKWQVNALAWQSRTFVFEDSPLDEVVKSLETVYGTEITLGKNNLANCRVNATYENESLGEVLESISLIFELEQTKNNNVITLSGKGCE